MTDQSYVISIPFLNENLDMIQSHVTSHCDVSGYYGFLPIFNMAFSILPVLANSTVKVAICRTYVQ